MLKASIRIVAACLAFSFFAGTSWTSAARAETSDADCENLLKPTQVAITDLSSFGQAMTEALLLGPNQGDLFEIYRAVYFGDAKVSVSGANLQKVLDILKQHPELSKIPFREFEISSVQKIYASPESLTKYLSKLSANAGQARSNLFQIEANLGFWKRLLGYKEQDRIKFFRYFDHIISPANRAFLKDDKTDYRVKINTLFGLLKRLAIHMKLRNRNVSHIHQAMLDLVNTAGFNNQSTVALLKSENALDKIEGLRKIIDERDSLAMDLGYVGHFVELFNELKAISPSVFIRTDDSDLIAGMEAEVLAGTFKTQASETERVRALSIQESPFRSCLGGSDCSTRTYFDKALDPNFNYFTITDSKNHSSGQITIVLGTATDQAGQPVKTAFVDKIQNVPNSKLDMMLEAIRLSLLEHQYILALPEATGGHNGLSNMDSIHHYVSSQILPGLRQRLLDFTPHPNNYNFKNEYSRAYLKLPLKVFVYNNTLENTEIKPGRIFKDTIAPADLNKENLVQELLNLKDSKLEADLIKYVGSGAAIEQLSQLKLYTEEQFQLDLIAIYSNPEHSFNLRKIALINRFLIAKPTYSDFLWRKSFFSDSEQKQIASELIQWETSADPKKKWLASLEAFQKFQALKTSTVESDILKFIGMASWVKSFNAIEQGIETKYLNDLFSYTQNNTFAFTIRQAALNQLLLHPDYISYPAYRNIISAFKTEERKLIEGKLLRWQNSSDRQQKRAALFPLWYQIFLMSESEHDEDLIEFLAHPELATNFADIGFKTPDYRLLLKEVIQSRRGSLSTRIAMLVKALSEKGIPNYMLYLELIQNFAADEQKALGEELRKLEQHGDPEIRKIAIIQSAYDLAILSVSKNDQDLLKYISSYRMVEKIESYKGNGSWNSGSINSVISIEGFRNDLGRIVAGNYSSEVKIAAMVTLIRLYPASIDVPVKYRLRFDKNEWQQIRRELFESDIKFEDGPHPDLELVFTWLEILAPSTEDSVYDSAFLRIMNPDFVNNLMAASTKAQIGTKNLWKLLMPTLRGLPNEFELKKKFLFEILLGDHDNFHNVFGNNAAYVTTGTGADIFFSHEEWLDVLQEIKTWSQSSDSRKLEYIQKLKDYFVTSDPASATSQTLIEFGIVSVNDRDRNDETWLSRSVRLGHKDAVLMPFIESHPELDLKAKDRRGYMLIDQIEAQHRPTGDLQREIYRRHPELAAHPSTLPWTERRKGLTLYFQPAEFVKVKGMGQVADFEIMNAFVTERMRSFITDWGESLYAPLEQTIMRSSFSGKELRLIPDKPIIATYEAERDLLQKLNELATWNNQSTIEKLRELIPDHERGDQYALPTYNQMIVLYQSAATSTHVDHEFPNGRGKLGSSLIDEQLIFGLCANYELVLKQPSMISSLSEVTYQLKSALCDSEKIGTYEQMYSRQNPKGLRLIRIRR